MTGNKVQLPWGRATVEEEATIPATASERAMELGVARLTGAGFGGCAVVFCRRQDLSKVHDGLVERFYFGNASHILQAEAGPGAVHS